jgi:hypothetical protein
VRITSAGPGSTRKRFRLKAPEIRRHVGDVAGKVADQEQRRTSTHVFLRIAALSSFFFFFFCPTHANFGVAFFSPLG